MRSQKRLDLPPTCAAVQDALPLHVSGDWAGGPVEVLVSAPGADAADVGGPAEDWIEAHLATCPRCAAELDAYSQSMAALQGAGSEGCPLDLWPAVAAAIGEMTPGTAAHGERDAAGGSAIGGSALGVSALGGSAVGGGRADQGRDAGVAAPDRSDGTWFLQRRTLGSLALAASFLVVLGFGIHQRYARRGEFAEGGSPHMASSIPSPGHHQGSVPEIDPFTVGLMTPVDVYGSSRLLVSASGATGAGTIEEGAVFFQREYVPVAAFSKLSF